MTAAVELASTGSCGLLASPECKRRKGSVVVREGWVVIVDGEALLCCPECREMTLDHVRRCK